MTTPAYPANAPLFAGLPGDISVSFEFFPPKTEKMEDQ
ncbi:MAG TPA: methylenetetrahydrofolate reductase [NAD(P)H], partial [Novosphingobium sp.]|nr:methylenetetrahydrofolate reductase [NAD(P)H] [Novosphingobium sp.]